MYVAASPILLYILTIYSLIFLVRSKTKNEFLLIFTIFCFLESMNSWENSIISIITTPINFRIIDIPLIILFLSILSEIPNKQLFQKLFLASKIFYLFLLMIIAYTVLGAIKYNYAAVAEFRLMFFYIIPVVFIISNVREDEILFLLKRISEYLIPLILLIPINILLTGNSTISEDNRTLGAFIYETITMGYIAGYYYWTYIDNKFVLFKRFLPVFLIFSIWANVRTVWAIIIAAIVFKLVFEKGRTKFIAFVAIVIIFIGLTSVVKINYLEKRFEAFTNISVDPTGKWRLLVWDAVIQDATLVGVGVGGRFNVYADIIGWDAKFGAHNGFIYILHNLGYIGLFSIIVLLISLTAKFLRAIQNTAALSSENMIYRLSLMSVLSLILYMMGYGPDLLSWIFIAFGLKYSLKTIVNNS